ncbi:MAG: hypothetical protein HY074_13620 [Deltaproteobacteria bacterium]|nr:hypothetical protein [Deltaproteobacteria bacterium]
MRKTVKSTVLKKSTGPATKTGAIRGRKVTKLSPLRGVKKVTVRKRRAIISRKKAA